MRGLVPACNVFRSSKRYFSGLLGKTFGEESEYLREDSYWEKNNSNTTITKVKVALCDTRARDNFHLEIQNKTENDIPGIHRVKV